MALYAAAQAIARIAARAIATEVRVRGTANLPAGPFLLVANHQSFLDPVLIQAFCPREVHSMAKSSQFAVPIVGSLMSRLHAYPVQRFDVDPQAVRTTLRKLRQGHAVCIYVEGERSWDARLQPPRLGTLRLILKAGVPVVPCAIAGSYDILPRWGAGLRRAPVSIAFGEPLSFGAVHDRAARERRLPEVRATVMGALGRLLAAAETQGTTRPRPDT